MRLRPLVLVAVLTAGTTSQAWGQTMPAVPTGAGQRDIKIGLRTAVVYNSNLAGGGQTSSGVRDIEPEDVSFRPQATVAITQPVGQQVLVLDGAVGYDFYRRNKRLNRPRAEVNGAGIARFFGCQETLFGTYRASQSELEDLDLGTTENLQQNIGVGVGLACGRPGSLQGNVVFLREEAHNSAATRKVSDSDSKSVSMNLAYGRPSLGTVSTFYSYSDSQFPNRILPGRPVGDGFFTETFGLGYERRVGSRILVNATVARTRLKREFSPPGEPQKLTTTSYAGSADYRPSSRLSVRVDAARRVMPSQGTGKLFDINTTYNGVIRYQVGTRIALSVGDTYQRSVSNGDTASPIAVVTRSRSNAVFATASYRQSERATISLDVRQQDRKTDLQVFNYTDTRVAVTADLRF